MIAARWMWTIAALGLGSAACAQSAMSAAEPARPTPPAHQAPRLSPAELAELARLRASTADLPAITSRDCEKAGATPLERAALDLKCPAASSR